MNTRRIKVNRLTTEDVEKLDTTTEVFVTGNKEGLPWGDAFAPAYLTKPGNEFEGGSFEFRTVFGEKVWEVASDDDDKFGICIANGNGAHEVEVIESAGLFLNLALFIPGESLGGLTKLVGAIQEAFGEGNAQVWNVSTLQEAASLVPDTKYDVFEVQSGRGRKGADGPKRNRIASGIFAQRVPFIEPQPGFKTEVLHHTPVVDETPTI